MEKYFAFNRALEENVLPVSFGLPISNFSGEIFSPGQSSKKVDFLKVFGYGGFLY